MKRNMAWRWAMGLVVVGLALGAVMTGSAAPAAPMQSGWGIVTVEAAGDVGQYTSLALDTLGRPHISYYRDASSTSGQQLRYAHLAGGRWYTQTVTNNGGAYTSLALDASNYPYISYQQTTQERVQLTYWDGSSWKIENASSSWTGGLYTSLALDSQGRPHISFYYRSEVPPADRRLNYARRDPLWGVEVVDGQWEAGQYSSLALDSQGQPHISYYNADKRTLNHARWTGAQWERQVVDDNGDVGRYTSLALDSLDRPHISYYDATTGDLRYARWDGAAWQRQTVDSQGNVGQYTSLALDSLNRPHISYYDVTQGDLRYAFRDGGAWRLTTVDSQGDVGRHTSLALDANGYPRISYYDQTNASLKYAYSLAGLTNAIYLPLVTRAR